MLLQGGARTRSRVSSNSAKYLTKTYLLYILFTCIYNNYPHIIDLYIVYIKWSILNIIYCKIWAVLPTPQLWKEKSRKDRHDEETTCHVVVELYCNPHVGAERLLWEEWYGCTFLSVPDAPEGRELTSFIYVLGLPGLHEACHAGYNWALYSLCAPLIWMPDLS